MNKSALRKVLSNLFFLFLFVINAFSQQEIRDDQYFKINKAFESFSAVFRELAQNYVIPLNPDDLVYDAINGMLANLDPYTNYVTEEQTEDLDMISTGSYVGLGISVGIRDSILTIVGLQDGFSAQQAGIRIGDRILNIDSTYLYYSSSDDLKNYTRGKPGSKLTMKIERPGFDKSDTLNFNLERKQIKLKNIPYFGFLSSDIAYFKVDRFSRTTAEDLRDDFNSLKRQRTPKGVIIDLRNNPGGLLEAAVALCEIFLPENSPIVSIKGKYREVDRNYNSILKPIDSNVPMAILINGGSASASEIVAGAIQDLDRGIIIGQKSFGKGLVQSVFEMPFKANLKITTARYYTPSGRCIHKLRIDQRNHSRVDLVIHGDSVFYTKNKRPLVESKGIIPDTSVSEEAMPEPVMDLVKNNHFFNFATFFSSDYDSLPPNFKINGEIMSKFENYLKTKNYSYKSALIKDLETAHAELDKENINDKTKKDYDNLLAKIKKEEPNIIEKYSKNIKDILFYEIFSRFNSDEKVISKSLEDDNFVLTAKSIIISNLYKAMLSISDYKGNN